MKLDFWSHVCLAKFQERVRATRMLVDKGKHITFKTVWKLPE